MRGGGLLLALTGAGGAWALHLFAGYFLVSLGCARGWPALTPMLAVVTGVCAAGAVAVALTAWSARGKRGASEASRLLLGAAGSLGLLFAIMIVLGGLAVAALPPCQAAIAAAALPSQPAIASAVLA